MTYCSFLPFGVKTSELFLPFPVSFIPVAVDRLNHLTKLFPVYLFFDLHIHLYDFFFLALSCTLIYLYMIFPLDLHIYTYICNIFYSILWS